MIRVFSSNIDIVEATENRNIIYFIIYA